MSTWKDDNGYWKTPLYVVFWGGVAVLLVTAIVLGIWAQATWWEDHKTERGRGDSPVTAVVQNSDIYVVEMPDTFANVASTCVWEGYRGFVVTNDGGTFVVPDEDCDQPDYVPVSEVTP